MERSDTVTINNFWKLEKFSFFHQHYAFVDVGDYLADQIFINNKIPVRFGVEYFSPRTNYYIIFCRIRKSDIQKFEASMEELKNKMLLMGHKDYCEVCADLHQIIY